MYPLPSRRLPFSIFPEFLETNFLASASVLNVFLYWLLYLPFPIYFPSPTVYVIVVGFIELSALMECPDILNPKIGFLVPLLDIFIESTA